MIARPTTAALGLATLALLAPPAAAGTRSAEYSRVQAGLARGWNTWDTQSVLSQVLLPEGLSISVGVLTDDSLWETSPRFLDRALIGRQGSGGEIVHPGPHAYDGSYTDLTLEFHGARMRVQSADSGGDLVLLVTPLPSAAAAPTVVFSVAMLWGLPGRVSKGTESIAAETPSGTLEVYLCGPDSELGSAWTRGAYFASSLAGPVAVSTGRRRSLGEAQAAVLRGEARYRASLGAHGASAEIMGAIETVLGWDTIYDPTKARVITPVSRVWNVGWGGYVLFDWDTFFAAEMAAVDDRDLAYANVLEMLAEATSAGFIPNFARSRGLRSEDRSEPPVGSRVTLDLFRRYHDRWMVEEAFPALLAWNRWWAAHRDRDGYLVWGSSAPEPGARPMDPSAHTLQGAKFESGLDNSPMYDGAAFDEATGQMEFADVGLMSLYVDDCGALATLADALGRSAEAAEIRERGSRYQAKLRGLWSEKDGIFLNRDLRTGAPSLRLSPTNFYPMLSGTATPEQARRMVAAHLMNPAEFWGEWVIPSIARNDPAFKDQDYWRGRIWGPMNYLVYLGLRNYDLPEARRALADRSAALFVREWRTKGHISENYDGATGSSDIEASDRFYHWGALLGLIKVEEDSGPPPPPIQAPADPSQ